MEEKEYHIMPYLEDEVALLFFLQAEKAQGYAYPNYAGGTLYRLWLDPLMAANIQLKFRLQECTVVGSTTSPISSSSVFLKLST